MSNATIDDPITRLPNGAAVTGLVLAGIAFLGMLGGIFAYALFGQRLTDGLDQACAEAAFKAGQQLEERGNYEGAEQRFRQAMEGDFASKEQRYMCGRSIGELLSRRQHRYAEAVEVYESLPAEALTESGHFTAYVLSLWHSGHLEEAAEKGAVWLRLAEQEQNRDQRLWAHNALMHVARGLGNPQDVMEHGEAVLELDPGNVAALLVARTQMEQGDREGALERVNAFISKTENPAHLAEAKALRSEIAAAG